MGKNKFIQSLKNVSFSFLTFAITSAIGLAMTPYIINKISEYQFGLFRLILEFKMYLALSDMGMSISSSFFFSKAIATKEKRSIQHVLKSILKMSLRILPVTAAVTIVLYFFLPKEIEISKWKLDTTFFSIMFTAFVYQPLNAFIEYLRADEREDIVAIASFCQQLLITSFTLLFLNLGFDILSLAASYILAALIFALIIIICAMSMMKKYPDLKEQSYFIDNKKIWSHNKYAFLKNISSNLTHYSDNIILANMLSVSSITPFYINLRFPQVAQQISQSLGGASWASLIKIYYTGDLDNFRTKFNITNKAIIYITFSILATIYLYNRSFISLWMDKDYFISHSFNIVACAMPILFAVNSFWNFLITGSGNLNKVVPWLLIASIINFILSIIFTKQFGSIGVILGTFVSILIGYLWVSVAHLKKIFKLPVLLILSPLIKATIASTLYIYLFYYLSFHHFAPQGFITLLLYMGLSFGVLSLILLPIIFSKDELLFWSNRITSFYRKKS